MDEVYQYPGGCQRNCMTFVPSVTPFNFLKRDWKIFPDFFVLFFCSFTLCGMICGYFHIENVRLCFVFLNETVVGSIKQAPERCPQFTLLFPVVELVSFSKSSSNRCCGKGLMLAVWFQGFVCHLLARCLSVVRDHVVLVGFQILLN